MLDELGSYGALAEDVPVEASVQLLRTAETNHRMRSMKRWVMCVLAVGCLGCPDPKPEKKTISKTDPPAKKTVANPPTPKVAPGWTMALTSAGNHPRVIAGALKDKTKRETLAKPFSNPSPELLRLITLTRWLVVYDGKLKRPAALIRRLRHHLRKPQYKVLDPGFFGPNAPQTVGILVLQDPGFLYDAGLLATAKGWVSIRRGSKTGTFDANLSDKILRAVAKARANRWAEAIPLFSAAFLDLGKRNTAWLGSQGARDAWQQVDTLYRDNADPQALTGALRDWMLFFQAKPKKSRLPRK